MNGRGLIASLALALSSVPAFAGTTDLGTLDANGSSFSQAFTRWFGSGSPLGAFTDYYTFNLASDGGAHGTIFSFDVGFVDLDLKSVSLYPTANPSSAFVDTSVDSFSFSKLLAKTSYTLAVSGTLKSLYLDTGGAYYQGTIRSIASPAPEPAALALAVAGLLGVLGLSRSRKS
jgi:hypothetical protein